MDDFSPQGIGTEDASQARGPDTSGAMPARPTAHVNGQRGSSMIRPSLNQPFAAAPLFTNVSRSFGGGFLGSSVPQWDEHFPKRPTMRRLTERASHNGTLADVGSNHCVRTRVCFIHKL